MRISEQDIVSTARQLCDEENSQLSLRPWSRRRRFSVPGWLVALPAAAIVGFVVGFWAHHPERQEGARTTAMVDTVYITTAPTPASPDTALAAGPVQSAPAVRPAPRRVRHQPAATTTGQPVGRDQIRYDLLVRN